MIHSGREWDWMNKNKINMENKDYMSLYDFLGYAAGGELGKEVATEAAKKKIKLETREIDNPTYQGIVYLYPKTFLKEYFETKNLKSRHCL
jgi:hypothetical protein|tara:strand:+ start:814 stop:1086 length:273 start_codon:yes stop_codon:yes gene_type:complete